MPQGEGTLAEIWREPGGLAGWVRCSRGLVPAPGQYTLARPSGLAEPAALPTALFAGFAPELGRDGFAAAGPLPAGWLPGQRLALRGPLGVGFRRPPAARRVGLLGLSRTLSRLLAFAVEALRDGLDVVLVTDQPLPEDLPPAVETLPLAAWPEAGGWVEYLAIDVPADGMARLRGQLGLAGSARLAFPAQALVETGLPCGGLGLCGACAVRGRRGWKYTCKDGPVFEFHDLEW